MSRSESGGDGSVLHHFGIIVASIEESVADVSESMSARWTHPISVDEIQKVRVTFLTHASGGALIELVEPIGADSPVARFLATGGGMNHLCYEVDDLERQIERMKRCGGRLIRSPQPAIAFAQRRIAWMLTRQRVLIEYLERGTVTE